MSTVFFTEGRGDPLLILPDQLLYARPVDFSIMCAFENFV